MTRATDIATVSLNAAVDQTANVPNFALDAVNRVAWEQSDAGGKGVNVASFLAHFGHPVAVTGLLGADNIDLFVRWFDARGLVDRFVRVPGHTRVNVKIVDEDRNTVTDVNFPGVEAEPKDVEAVLAVLDDLASAGTRTFVLSGSLPGGVPVTVYREMTWRLKGLGCRVVLDTSGDAFAEAIDAGPDVVKPNIDELTEIVGRPLDGDAAIVGAARDLVARGVGLVAVSMGARGAAFVTADDAVHAQPPKVTVKSTVGAGDAMVAGIVHATSRDLALADVARLATAFSMGALGEIGPRLPARDAIEAFAGQVTIRSITV